MLYRIRYKTEMGVHSGETSVEANSPAEAVVKFRLIQPNGSVDSSDSVTSVSLDPPSQAGDC